MSARSGRWAVVLRSWRGAGIAAAFAASALLLVAAPVALVHADDHAIAITDAGFEPDTLTVVVGETVTWTNTTATERSVFVAVGVLDSGPILPGKSFTNVFQATGTLAYHDGSDPALTGTIIVQPPVVQVTSGSPPATPPVSVVQSGGNGPALFLAVAVVGVIAVAAALAGLIGASRRPGR
jgi:plastocyanin